MRQVAVVEAFNRRSGASDIFTLELSDVIVNDTCASISQECFPYASADRLRNH